jgi:hypothetical protein
MLLGAVSVIGIVGCLAAGIPRTSQTCLIAAVMYAAFLTMWISILVWIIRVLRIKIYTDENGITYVSPSKQMQIKWSDITQIERKYYYSGSFPMGGPPKDLLIRSKAGDSLKVFDFLVNSETLDDEEGNEDFVSEIRKHTSLAFD